MSAAAIARPETLQSPIYTLRDSRVTRGRSVRRRKSGVTPGAFRVPSVMIGAFHRCE